jgi:hypothetical protein
MRRRRGRAGATGAQLLRVRVRAASRMSVKVDAAANIEPETAGRKGRDVHTATVQLAADGCQAFACRLGFDLRIALRAELAIKRADECCTQRGPPVHADKAALRTIPTTARMHQEMRAMQTSRAYQVENSEG